MDDAITLAVSYADCNLSFFGEPNTYTVTLDRQSGSGGTSSVTATYAAAMPSATMPTRTGYTFGGYYTAANGGGTQYYKADGTSAKNWDKTSAITLYAQWTVNTYTLTFNPNGGTYKGSTSTYSYPNASSSTPPTYGKTYYRSVGTPTRTGYDFLGWYTAVSGGAQVYDAAGKAVKGDYWTESCDNGGTWKYDGNVTVYARWTPKTYTLVLNPNGGTYNGSASSRTYSPGNSSTPPTYGKTYYRSVGTPTRTGYAFLGWYTTATTGGYQVYDADGKAVKCNVWTESCDNGGTWKYDGNVTVYARWTERTYTLTMNPNGGTYKGSTSTYSYPNASSSTPPTYGRTYYRSIGTPAQDGYDFLGWYSAATGGYQVYDADGKAVKCNVWTEACDNGGTWKYDGNVTVYAHWTPSSYAVTLNQQGGSGGTTNVTAAYNSAMPSITKPTCTGYTFDGYYTGTGGSGTQYYTAAGASARTWNLVSNTTLYAKWTPKTYTLTFNPKGGTYKGSTSTYSYPNASSSTPPTYGRNYYRSIGTPAQTGYDFLGWYSAATGGYQVYDADGKAVKCNVWTEACDNGGTWKYDGNVTVYAHWTPSSYAVTLNQQGGSGGTASVTATYGSAMPGITVPTRTAYTFGGYYTGANGSGTPYYSAAGASLRNWDLSSNTTLYAKWTQNPVVTFVMNGGTFQNGWMTPTNYVEGVGMSLPTAADITYANRAFIGWYEDEMCLGDRVTRISSSDRGNRTFYARWEGRTYKVSFDVNGGGGRDHQEQSLSMTNSERLKTLAELYITPQGGYTFAEWNTAVDGSGNSYSDGAVIENNLTNVANTTVTLYAQWSPNPYEVAFRPNGADGGETMDNQSFVYDVTQALDHVAFTCTGYAFKGWSTTTNRPSLFYADEAKVVNLATGGVVNLYANWTGLVYTVTFDANGGEGEMEPITCTYNVQTNLPYCTFKRDGWGFEGWTNSLAEGVLFLDHARVTNLTATAGAEVTMYACWTGVTYAVTLDARDALGRGDGALTNGMPTLTGPYVVGDAWNLPIPTNADAHLSFSGWTYVDTNGVTVTVAESDVVPPPSVFGGATNLVAAWDWVVDPLAAAVDAPELSFATRGTVGPQGKYNENAYDASWFVQTDYVHDSTSAVQSGALLEQGDPDNNRLFYASWLTTTVTTKGVLTFWWKYEAPECESIGEGNFLGYSFHFGELGEGDGGTGLNVRATLIDDDGWHQVVWTNDVAGSVTFAWQFRFTDPDGTATIGGTGWVDRVTWTPKESPTGDVTPTHGVAYKWLEENFPDEYATASGDAEALDSLAKSDSPSGKAMKVWQEYWAGTDPYNPNDLFRARIAVTNNVPYISWQPDLSVTGDPKRVYKVLCAPTLSAQEWVEWPGGSGASTNRFFKVKLILEEE